MKMLLRDVEIRELAQMFRRHRKRSPSPCLTDPRTTRRARRLAKKNGVWDELTRNLDANRDIPVIKRSAWRNYQRVGYRSLPQSKSSYRQKELARAAMALWLGHPKADIDYLQDLLWAFCDAHTWVMAAHEGRAIDLGSAGLGATLAEILHVLGDRLEDEVNERVAAEIDRRIFQRFFDYRHPDGWRTGRQNWNHVCNGEIIRAALYLIQDPAALACVTHAAIQNMTYALDGFAEDGGCREGPGYWAYGFGHYLVAAHALYMKTDGELNIMADPKIERICRYPLAVHIAGPLRATFADSHHGYLPARIALIINQFYEMPEIYNLCARHPDRTLKLSGWHELAFYRGHKVRGQPDHRDYLLPELDQVKLRGKPGKDQVTLVAKAGDNDVPHNHNDIGSFIVHKRNRLVLVDPGGPRYTRKTFSPRRYEIAFCSSMGHSVPVINGKLQSPGGRYRGTLAVENLNGEGEKRVVIDMTRAYPKGTVRKLIRTFTLDPDANRLTMEDAYTFSRPPESLVEAFIAFEKVRVARDRRSVLIGPARSGVRLKALETPGAFSAVRLVEESKEGPTGEVITRICFVPESLAREMRLRFEVA